MKRSVSSCVGNGLRHGFPLRVPAAFAFAGFLIFSASIRAQETQQTSDSQDVAAAARAEKARKQSQKKNETHVYTEADLAKPKILTAEDQQKVEARKRDAAPAAPTTPGDASPTEALDANKNSVTEPLGDVARRYRGQKEARLAEQARKNTNDSKFHLTIPEPVLAHPIVAAPLPVNPARPVAPMTYSNSLPSAEKISPRVLPTAPLIRTVPPNESPAVRKISPFQPRPLMVAPAPMASVPMRFPSVNISPRVVPREIPRNTDPHVGVKPLSPAALASLRTVRIVSGDTLWSLSRRYLGAGSRWQELIVTNTRLAEPTRLAVGTEIFVPARAPHSLSLTSVRVRSGQTLWSLAKVHLGAGTAWTCIAQANPQISDPHRLVLGQAVTIPATCFVN